MKIGIIVVASVWGLTICAAESELVSSSADRVAQCPFKIFAGGKTESKQIWGRFIAQKLRRKLEAEVLKLEGQLRVGEGESVLGALLAWQ